MAIPRRPNAVDDETAAILGLSGVAERERRGTTRALYSTSLCPTGARIVTSGTVTLSFQRRMGRPPPVSHPRHAEVSPSELSRDGQRHKEPLPHDVQCFDGVLGSYVSSQRQELGPSVAVERGSAGHPPRWFGACGRPAPARLDPVRPRPAGNYPGGRTGRPTHAAHRRSAGPGPEPSRGHWSSPQNPNVETDPRVECCDRMPQRHRPEGYPQDVERAAAQARPRSCDEPVQRLALLDDRIRPEAAGNVSTLAGVAV